MRKFPVVKYVKLKSAHIYIVIKKLRVQQIRKV